MEEVRLERLSETVSDIIYWRNEKLSALLFTSGLLFFLLVIWWQYSVLTVVSYVLIFHLLARFVHRNASHVLAELNLLERRPATTVPNTFFSEEEVQQYLSTITATLNSVTRTAFSMAVCDDNIIVGKWMAALYFITLVNNLFGTTGFMFLVYLAIFTLPKTYKVKRREIDGALSMAHKAASQGFQMLMEKIPKASDLKKQV